MFKNRKRKKLLQNVFMLQVSRVYLWVECKNKSYQKKQGDVIQMNRINEAHVYDKKQVINRERALTPNIMHKGTLSK